MPVRGSLPFDPIEEAQRQWTAHGWGAQAGAMAVVTSIMRVEQILLARVDDALRPFGLTFARFEALALLSFAKPAGLPLGKVGQRLQVHPASVTNAIDRLEAQGLARRRPHPSDGRTTLAQITPKGRRTAGRATDALNRVFDQLDLSRGEASELFVLLRKLRQSEGDFAVV
jgi:DNA-binding MarR family transcriptional regulator